MKTPIEKFTIPLVFIIFTIFACEKDDGLTGNRENYYHEETYCADRWEHSDSASDEVLKERVSEYLTNTLDVEFSNLHITHDGTSEACRACHCRTGRIIRIEADEAYQDILIENGFKEE